MNLGRVLKFLSFIAILFLISCGENKCSYLGDKSKFQGVPTASNPPSWLQGLPKMLSDVVSDRLFGAADPSITTKGLIGSRMMIADNKQTTYKQDDPSTHSQANFATVDKNRGTVYSMYAGIVRSTEYRAVYYLGLTLYVTIIGLMYLLGMTEMTLQKSMPLLFKIGIISLFTNPTLSGATGMPIGWSAYYNVIVGPAVYAMEAFAMYFASVLFNLDINQVENGFVPIAVMMTFIFNDTFWIKMTTLIFSGVPMGFATFIIMIVAMVIYIISGVLSIMTYMVVISTLGILFAIGPVFFLFLLFEKTKLYFEKWWKQIIALMLQQYSLFVAISIFGYIILKCAQSALSFNVVCTTVIKIELISLIDIPIFYYYTADLGTSATLTLAMYAVFFWMLTAIYATTIQKVAELGAGLVAGASAVGGASLGMTATAWDKASSMMKEYGSNAIANAYQTGDKVLKAGVGVGTSIASGNYMGALTSMGSLVSNPFEKPKSSTERISGYKDMFTQVAGAGAGASAPSNAPSPSPSPSPAPQPPAPPMPSPMPAAPMPQQDSIPVNLNAPPAPPPTVMANGNGTSTYTSASGASANFGSGAYVVDNGNQMSMADYLSQNPNINLNDTIPENLIFSGSESGAGYEYGRASEGAGRVGNGTSYTYADMLSMSQPPPGAESVSIAPSYT